VGIDAVCKDCFLISSPHYRLTEVNLAAPLRLLRAARLLRANRKGKQVFYNVADEHIRCVLIDMVEHVAESVDGSEDT
jgi:hypothetical protein